MEKPGAVTGDMRLNRAAAMAKYVDEDIGVRPLVVNHTKVSAIRSPLFSAMYMW